MHLLEIIESDEVQSHMKILHVLYDTGFATREQLGTILGWNQTKLNNQLTSIKKMEQVNGKCIIERKNLRGLTQGRPICAYRLSQLTVNQIKDVRGVNTRLKVAKEYQLNHYLGITDILARLLRSLRPEARKHIEWWSEYDSRTFITSEFTRKVRSVTKDPITRATISKCVSPDAHLRILHQPFWIEFDNNTERKKKIQERYDHYINTYRPRIKGMKLFNKSIEFPIIWITTNFKRKQFMEQEWNFLKREYQRNNSHGRTIFPKMYFFVEGEETELLIQYFNKMITNKS